MDVARAIALSINHHRDLFDYDDLIGGDKYVTEGALLCYNSNNFRNCISEVGRSAIISEDESKGKQFFSHQSY